ncbi:hypothetical protein B0H12DRAFT_474732 [Mycena haematopus]|nr:hypothetical protein B0H12DRAFT_474732 [Mycena haematopus]
MDRPLGPRQPPERNAAYEDIFGRRPAPRVPQYASQVPPMGRPPGYPQSQYAPSLYPHPQYPQQQGQYYPQQHPHPHPQQQYAPATAGHGQVNAQGLTPAQAYQAQVALGGPAAAWRSPSPVPGYVSGGPGYAAQQAYPYPHAQGAGGGPRTHEGAGPAGVGRQRDSLPPALSIPIGADGGRLGISFDEEK